MRFAVWRSARTDPRRGEKKRIYHKYVHTCVCQKWMCCRKSPNGRGLSGTTTLRSCPSFSSVILTLLLAPVVRCYPLLTFVAVNYGGIITAHAGNLLGWLWRNTSYAGFCGSYHTAGGGVLFV